MSVEKHLQHGKSGVDAFNGFKGSRPDRGSEEKIITPMSSTVHLHLILEMNDLF